LLVTACATGREGAPHPLDAIDYPVAVTADPSGEVLWVTSGNFDLAYGGGAVLALQLETLEFIPGAAFEVASFPGPVALFAPGGTTAHAYVTSREQDALYHANVSGPAATPTTSCEGGEPLKNGIVRCPAVPEVELVFESGETAALSVGPDPFGALAVPARVASVPDLLLSGAMVGGNLATYELDATGGPTLVGNLDLAEGLFAMAINPVNGRIYTASKDSGTVSVLEVRAPHPDETVDPTNPWVHRVRDITIPRTGVADHARGVAVSADGGRLYVAFRGPPSLAVIDISLGEAGGAADKVLSKVPVGPDPGDVVVVPAAGGLPELVFVSCFAADRLDVVDPALGLVVGHVPTGDGPFGMAFVERPDLPLRRLYVANFRSQTIGVVELAPESPYFLTEIAEVR
jgi:DNA-binding beta-propeller fold protein YncE